MEERFKKMIFEKMTETVWLMDFQGHINYITPSVEKTRGFGPEEMKNMTLEQHLAPESLVRARQVIAAELSPDKLADKNHQFSWTGDLEFTVKGGGTVWREVIVSLLREDDGRPLGLLGVGRDITLKRAAEQALKESEKRLRLALEASEEGLWDWNLKTGEVYLSPRVFTMLGYQPGEIPVTAEAWKNMLHPEDRLTVMESIDFGQEKISLPPEREFRLRAKNGTWRWIFGRGRITEWDGSQKPARISGTLVEITEKKRMTEALKASESRYRNLFNNTYAVMMLVDGDSGAVVDANPAACLFYGYSRDVIRGKQASDFNLLPRERVFENLHNALAGKERVFYSKHRLANGEIRDVQVYAGPIETQGKRLLFSVIQDVTGQSRVELSLKDAEKRFFTVFQSSPEMIIISTLPEGRILEVNEAYTRVSGYAREEVVGRLAKDLDTWVDWQERDRIMRLAMREKKRFSFEARFRGKGSAVFHGYCSIAPFEWAGRPCLLWIAMDITSRKRTEEALKESEERYRQVAELVPSPIAVAEEGKFVYVNQAAVRVLGASKPEQILGREVMDMVHPDFRALAGERLRKVMEEDAENPNPVVIKVLRIDGREAVLETTSKPVPYNGKRAQLITGRDLTTEKELEKLITQMKKQK